MQRLEIAGHLATDTIDPSGHMIDETGRYYPRCFQRFNYCGTYERCTGSASEYFSDHVGRR
ncbi:hypothetical protein D3C85_1580780 [compost metagenome]|jgi:hypothetical protein